MPDVCIDASLVLAAILRDEQHAETAERLMDEWVSNARMFCPPLFWAETTSVIREQVYKGRYDASVARELLSRTLKLPVLNWDADTRHLQHRAYEFATQFNRPKAYDAQYLAVADLLGCELWTADSRLYNAVQGKLPWVRWVGEAA